MLKPFPFQLGEADAVSWFDILHLNIINGGLCYCYNLTTNASFRVSLLFASLRWSGPSNMRAVRGVNSYKFAYTYEKEVAVLIFNGLIPEIPMNYLGALPQLWFAFKHLLNLKDRSLFYLRALMVKTWQIRRYQGLDKLRRHVVAMHTRS